MRWAKGQEHVRQQLRSHASVQRIAMMSMCCDAMAPQRMATRTKRMAADAAAAPLSIAVATTPPFVHMFVHPCAFLVPLFPVAAAAMAATASIPRPSSSAVRWLRESRPRRPVVPLFPWCPSSSTRVIVICRCCECRCCSISFPTTMRGWAIAAIAQFVDWLGRIGRPDRPALLRTGGARGGGGKRNKKTILRVDVEGRKGRGLTNNNGVEVSS